MGGREPSLDLDTVWLPARHELRFEAARNVGSADFGSRGQKKSPILLAVAAAVP
jgi:hypothetical protein